MDEVQGLVPETKIAVTKTANIGLRVRLSVVLEINPYDHWQRSNSLYLLLFALQGGTGTFQYASNVIRPQEMWKDDIDNSANPFVPRIREKHNSLVPLDQSIITGTLETPSLEDSGLREHIAGVGGVTGFPHPYSYELTHIGYESWMMDSRAEVPYGALESTPITFVETEAQLNELANALDAATEIAIDLEAHQYRTFQGFCCLMQISTRNADWIVDTLLLRRHLHILNRSFTNPRIVKVLHGSDFDILWLQRDFGLYIVNMFDTGQAARVLEFPSYALSYLLKLYCGINADKQYQKADWRIRPLPEPMFRYARDDTHYLLYIYDRMRNEAIARANGSKELIHAILTRSRDLCLQRYEKDLCTPTSFMELLSKFRAVNLTHQQIEVFSAVYSWRDTICRLEDESARYVLPNHMILQIADKMPDDDKALQAACIPVPPLVKMNLPELLAVIKKAKAKGAQTEAKNSSKSSGYGQLPDVPTDVTSSEDLIRQAGWMGDYSSTTGSSLGGSGALYPSASSSFFNSDIGGGIGGSLASSGALDGTLGSGSGFELSASLSSQLGSDGEFLVDNNEDYSAKSKADQIRSSFNVSSWMPSTAHILKDEPASPAPSAPAAPSAAAPSSSSESGLFEGIPQSMEEIYRLSNRSKKNKKKRDADNEPNNADPAGSPQSPFFLQDGEGTTDIRAAKRAKMGETEAERSEFMSELGWAPGTPSKLPSNPPKGQKQPAASSGSFAPFDYSKHKEARPAPGHAQQTAARGHHGEQSINPYGSSSSSKNTKSGGNSGNSGNNGNNGRNQGGKSHRPSGRGGKGPRNE